MGFRRPDSLNYEFDPSDPNKVLKLLAQHIALLPRIPKKVLAMYYYENLPRAEIATGFDLTENEVELIRTQTVNSLRSELEQSDRAA